MPIHTQQMIIENKKVLSSSDVYKGKSGKTTNASKINA